jgi:drug/metabolite transporter (DMT)-like permease
MAGPSAAVQAAAFLAVTLQRACHNSFIEWAKGDSGTATYTVSSVIFVAQTFCVFVGWGLAYQGGGQTDVKKCFDKANLTKFAHIGMIYAMGDIFEMESVNYIDSSTYTVLSQSKLIMTALLMWVVEGKAQTLMQWFILFTTSAGMLEYVLVGKSKGGSMTFSPFGVSLAMVKVAISCYVAVLNSKAVKKDNNPFPVQFSCLKVSWAVTSLVYMVVKDGMLGDGDLFGQWTFRTFVLVFAGFILKTLFNQYLLTVLDAIWKNISEAFGVLLVYFAKVTFLGGTFDGTVFNAAFTVILACVAYILSKQSADAKKKSDICDELNPSAYPDLQASLLGAGRKSQ